MVFENIEKLKKEWTDKYVVVDDTRPELRRFSGLTGTVKTVNFSGRALVQFDGHNNTGWYDIEPKFLKVIAAPLPKPAKPEKAEKKAAPAKAEKPAAEKPAAKPASGGGSVADILAAARAKSGGAPAAPKAEAKPAAEAPKPSPGKMSTADILAMARGKQATPAAPKAEAPPAEAPKPVAKAPEPAPAAAPEPAAKPAKAKGGALPKDVAGIVAYCRKTDGK